MGNAGWAVMDIEDNIDFVETHRTDAYQIFKSTSSALYSWQSYVTNVAIKGVTGIALHQKTTVLARSGIKDKVLKAINSVTGSPIALQYQSGTGIVLLTQGVGYFLTIIHTK